MKKRIIALMLSLSLFLLSTQSAIFAAGNPNVDGGGGTLGTGTVDNMWGILTDTGYLYDAEGIRVSVVNATTRQTIGTPIDMSNSWITGTVRYSMSYKNKIQYKTDSTLNITQDTSYIAKHPTARLPNIIPWDESSPEARIAAIKNYFGDSSNVSDIAGFFGMSLSELTSGTYKLLIEPVCYFRFNGDNYALTATETALMDITYGGVQSRLWPLSHMNLPLSMYLERADLGIGVMANLARATRQGNTDILNYLGLGTITFTIDELEEDVTNLDKYRVDTDVYTSIELYSESLIDITPVDPAGVTFSISGRTTTYEVSDIVIPKNDSQSVWFKWRTPSTPGIYTITAVATPRVTLYEDENGNLQPVYSNKGKFSNNTRTISFQVEIIEDTPERTPHDPKADDVPENDYILMLGGNTISETPSNTWYKWKATWGVVNVTAWGMPIYGYIWENERFSATLHMAADIKPSQRCPTSTYDPYNGYTMKAGYGIEIEAYQSNTAASMISAQRARVYFPEFFGVGVISGGVMLPNYLYTRTLILDNITNKLIFKPNKYSTYNDNVHFTPVWYPDTNSSTVSFITGRNNNPNGLGYQVLVTLYDCWTPAGQLSGMVSSNIINIDGSVFDDWFQAAAPVN